MPVRSKSATYLKVRRWVDRDIAQYPRQSIALQGAFLVLLIASIGAYAAGPVAIAGFGLLAVPPWAAWTVFVLWRVVRLTRAATLKGDREYDRKGKFMLPFEYADSESVLAASRRRRRGRP